MLPLAPDLSDWPVPLVGDGRAALARLDRLDAAFGAVRRERLAGPCANARALAWSSACTPTPRWRTRGCCSPPRQRRHRAPRHARPRAPRADERRGRAAFLRRLRTRHGPPGQPGDRRFHRGPQPRRGARAAAVAGGALRGSGRAAPGTACPRSGCGGDRRRDGQAAGALARRVRRVVFLPCAGGARFYAVAAGGGSSRSRSA